MSFLGFELNAQANHLLLELCLALPKDQYSNIRTVSRSLAKNDPDQSGWISSAQLEKVAPIA